MHYAPCKCHRPVSRLLPECRARRQSKRIRRLLRIGPGFYEDERFRRQISRQIVLVGCCFRKYLGSSTRITRHSFWNWCAMDMGRAQRLCAVPVCFLDCGGGIGRVAGAVDLADGQLPAGDLVPSGQFGNLWGETLPGTLSKPRATLRSTCLCYALLGHIADFYQHASRFSTSNSNISARGRSLERKKDHPELITECINRTARGICAGRELPKPMTNPLRDALVT
jgi:hypothetical protein